MRLWRVYYVDCLIAIKRFTISFFLVQERAVNDKPKTTTNQMVVVIL